MSTKTLLKRLALGTVVAVGAGTLSLVTVSSANAAAGSGKIAIAINGASGASSNGTASAGLLAGAVTATQSTTLTATVLAGGNIGVVTSLGTGAETLVVSGGIIVPSNANYTSADQTTVTSTATGLAVQVKPNSGATSMTIQLYDGSALDVLGGTYAPTSKGTLSSQVLVTVASTSVAGTFDAGKSKVNTAVTGSPTNLGVDVKNVNSDSTTTIPNTELAQINFTLNDAYGTPLPAGATIATATGGGYVKFAALGSAGTATATTDVTTSSSGSLTVKQATSNAAASVTVTITYNGTVVATRTFNWLGEVAKVVAGSAKIVSTSEPDPLKTGNASFVVRYYDAAGNELFPANAHTATTVPSGIGDQTIAASGVSIVALSDGLAGGARPADTTTWTQVSGKVVGSKSGSATLQLQYVNASGTIIKSNTWTQSVAGDADSYTAKFDKASYTPGSIATLTITFKDSKGNLANHLVNKIAAAGETITIAGAPGTVVSAPTTADVAGGGTDAAGTISYQFTVSQVAGSYSAIVDCPQVDLKSGAAQTVAYSVASGSVSLEDVLKGIVSLIASINKQIAALAKLVTKK
jgi:hypothetical protein